MIIRRIAIDDCNSSNLVERRTFRRQFGRRSGWILLTVLTLLAITTMFLALFSQAVAGRRQSHRQAIHREQARRLLSSGHERALSQLVANPKFVKETWRLSLDAAGKDDAVVDIDISAGSLDHKLPRIISVRVRYPIGGKVENTFEKQFALTGIEN